MLLQYWTLQAPLCWSRMVTGMRLCHGSGLTGGREVYRRCHGSGLADGHAGMNQGACMGACYADADPAAVFAVLRLFG
jgi:hypothetical protein